MDTMCRVNGHHNCPLLPYLCSFSCGKRVEVRPSVFRICWSNLGHTRIQQQLVAVECKSSRSVAPRIGEAHSTHLCGGPAILYSSRSQALSRNAMRLGDSHVAWRERRPHRSRAICAPVRDCRWPVVIPTQRGFPGFLKSLVIASSPCS